MYYLIFDEMIKLYQNKVLFRTYEFWEMKNIKDIEIIYSQILNKLGSIREIKIPKYCDEPLQYIMREKWFILESF